MKKTEGQTIAQEVWNMIPDEAKKQMKGVKKSFMESVAADVDSVVDGFAEWMWKSGPRLEFYSKEDMVEKYKKYLKRKLKGK